MKPDEKKSLLDNLLKKTSETFAKLGLKFNVVDKTRIEKLIEFKKTGDESLKPEKFEDLYLEDGVTMIIIEPAVEVGAAAVMKSMDGEPVAAPSGEYILQDKRTVVVEPDGVVKEVREAATDAGEDGLEAKPASTPNPVDDRVKRVIERIETEKIFEKIADLEKTVKFLKEENEAFKKAAVETQDANNETFKKLLGEPAKEPAVKPKTFSIESFKEESMMEQYLNKFAKTNE